MKSMKLAEGDDRQTSKGSGIFCQIYGITRCLPTGLYLLERTETGGPNTASQQTVPVVHRGNSWLWFIIKMQHKVQLHYIK